MIYNIRHHQMIDLKFLIGYTLQLIFTLPKDTDEQTKCAALWFTVAKTRDTWDRVCVKLEKISGFGQIYWDVGQWAQNWDCHG